MKVDVLIDSVDYSAFAYMRETRVEQAADGQVSTAKVTLRIEGAVGSLYGVAVYGSSTYGSTATPDFALKEIVIQESGSSPVNTIFRGEVVRAMRRTRALQFDEWTLDCQGYEAVLDREVVTDTWANQTDRAIIQDAFGAQAPDISVTSASVDVVESNLYLDSISWTLRELLDRLASVSGARWFLTPDKVLYYGLEGSTTAPAAPFNIDVEFPNGTTKFSTQLERGTEDYLKVANYVIVQGGYTSGGTRVTYTAQDATSQSAYGVRKKVVVEEALTTSALCQARAEAEIIQWKDPQGYGTFDIRRDGLAVGQRIQITARALGLSGEYQIKRIGMRWENENDTVYSVEYGFYNQRLDVLLRQIARNAARDRKGTILALPPEDSVDTVHIKALAVTTAKIANLAVTDAKIDTLGVNKLTAQTAAFGGVTIFGYGNNKLTLSSSSLKIEQSTGRHVNITSSGVRITGDSCYAEVTDTGINLYTNSLSGSQMQMSSTGLTLKGTSSGAQAVLTASSLTFTSGTANTVVSAAGVQIYGGTTGIGIGDSAFATSPVRISSTEVVIAIGSAQLTISNGVGVQANDNLGSGGEITALGNIETTLGAFYVTGNKVVGGRGAAVADATGAGDVVAQLNTLLARLRASTGHGLISG